MLFLVFSLSSVDRLYEMLVDEDHWSSLMRFLERWRSRGVLVGDREAVRKVFEHARTDHEARQLSEPENSCWESEDWVGLNYLLSNLDDGLLPVIGYEDASKHGVRPDHVVVIDPLNWFKSFRFCEPLSGSVLGDAKLAHHQLASGLSVSESMVVIDPYLLSIQQKSFVDFLVNSIQEAKVQSVVAYCVLPLKRVKADWFDPAEVCERLCDAVRAAYVDGYVEVHYYSWVKDECLPDHVMHDRYLFMGSNKTIESNPRVVSVGHPRALEDKEEGNAFVQSTSFSIVSFLNSEQVLKVWKKRSTVVLSSA